MTTSSASSSSSSSSTLPDLTLASLFSLSDKVVLVTGGGTGLGLSMATAFVQNGAKVYIASRKMNNLQKAADDLNAYRHGSCIPITADLTTKAGCEALGREMTSREPGGLDVLVNNSGVSWGSELENVDEKRGWDRVFDVNVKSVFYLTVSLLPLLEKKATSPSSPSSVINITSIYASLANPYMPTVDKPGQGAWSYLASKGAAAHLTRVLSTKLKPKNINVNAIAPGFYPTNMTASGMTKSDDPLVLSHPAGQLGSPRDIAGPAILLASPAGAHLSGVTITTDGGFTLQRLDRLPEEVAKWYKPPAREGGEKARL